MKENEPEEYQKFIEQLEDEVAKVPSENYDRNLILYKELNDLEPENELYSSKISFYETKRDEAIAAEKRRKEQEKLAEIQAEEKRKQRELEEEAAAKAENVRKGFHCLSGWDGSHAGVKKYVEDNLKDPDSFEHVETRITPVNDNGTHTLSMRYRARNGFGGMTIGIAIATIQNSGCGATIMSVE